MYHNTALYIGASHFKRIGILLFSKLIVKFRNFLPLNLAGVHFGFRQNSNNMVRPSPTPQVSCHSSIDDCFQWKVAKHHMDITT